MTPRIANQNSFLKSLLAWVLAGLGLAAWGMQAKAAEPAPRNQITEEDRRFWSFRKPVRPAVPRVRHAEQVRTPIDAFVLDRLEAKGLAFSPDADRATLLRRASLDLTGLPPTPEEIDAFLVDKAPGAYERLLDRLVASPHFGERWGRHWLDVVGYADTVGFDTDANNLILSEGKWRYRDYVVRAFNEDKPYDRFITEQLAGDELVDWRGAKHFTPAIRECLTATGYLRTARDESHEPESNIPLTYFGVLHDTVEIVGNSLLGLTLNCARCHDHKFDPVPQRDYYQLMAILTPAYNPKDWKPVFPWKPEIKHRGLPDVSAAEQAEIDRHNQEIDRQVADLKKQLAEVHRPYEARLSETKLAALPEPIRADTKTALATPAEKRNEIQKYLAGKFAAALAVKPADVTAALNTADKATDAKINDRITALNGRRQSFGMIQAIYDVGLPPATHLLKRGNYETPGAEVQPGFLSVLCEPASSPTVPTTAGGTTSGRRTALARWLTSPDTPASGLLTRVLVNRLWQHVYGQGLVPTPENLGRSGEPPTHPELLEWLSTEFTRNGWRVKPLLKLMMTSTAYRQASRHASAPGSDPQAIDPGNQLLWRMRLRRLESEVIRDTILAISGQLDGTMGGPPVLLEARPDGMVILSDKGLGNPSAKRKRSIYLLARRAYNLSLLTVFDQPLVAVTCPRRDASAVPLQSLMMLNNAFLLEHAGHFADRVARTAGTTGEKPIQLAFRLALGRAPSDVETRSCADLLSRQAALYQSAKLPGGEAERKALVQLCHTLFNTSEFLYAE
jgi:hypothetical protein